MKDQLWPRERAGDALHALASAAGLPTREVVLPAAPAQLSSASIARFLTDGADWIGLEAEAFETTYAEIERTLRDAAPALLELEHGLLALVRGGARPLIAAPDGGVRPIDLATLRDAMAAPFEAPLLAETDRLLAIADVAPARSAAARTALLAERLQRKPIPCGWLLRPGPTEPFTAAVRRVGARGLLAQLLGSHLLAYLLFVGAWGLLGRGALAGRVDQGWLAGWLLLLISSVPCRAAATHAMGELAVRIGGLLKQRLLAGALAMRPEDLRREGVGQLLGRVLESNAIETLAIGGAIKATTASLELVVALAILSVGAGSWLGVMSLAAWLLALATLARRYARARDRWATQRLTLTHDLVERMVGHRTRLVQELPERWHDGEDHALAYYCEVAKNVDTAGTRLGAWVPRGFLLCGIASLAPRFVMGDSALSIAVGLGGVLLAYRALASTVAGVGDLAGAAIAWRLIRPIFEAAARYSPPPAPLFAVGTARAADGEMLVEAHDLSFRYADRGEPILRACTLSIRAGERLLITGSSGGGKSTLGSLLAGLRAPSAGLLLLGGLDRHTLSTAGWRRRVVASPQFHENHIFVGTLAFNLLFGRAWPPTPADLDEARVVCDELGLGPVISRMPSGLEQMVGEVGWQLSHGERSRLFIARALLQHADLVVLDESFAALDPETLQLAMACATKRARTLVVIAHP